LISQSAISELIFGAKGFKLAAARKDWKRREPSQLSRKSPVNLVGGFGLNNVTGNDGKKYPVQSLWSNESAGDTGYCAGAGDDFPVTG
jgi:hypothetical protein